MNVHYGFPFCEMSVLVHMNVVKRYQIYEVIYRIIQKIRKLVAICDINIKISIFDPFSNEYFSSKLNDISILNAFHRFKMS